MEPKVVEQRAALARREDPDDLLAPASERARAAKTLFGRPRKIRRPSWCSSLTQEQWTEFRGALVEALVDTGEPYPPDDDPQTVYITANDGRPVKIAVPTLIDMVTYLPSTHWASEIAGVLDLERRATEASRRKSFARGAESIRPATFPLLLHADQVPDIPGLLTRTHGADLVALLEVRANRQQHFVHESDLLGWGTTAEALWSAAMHNLEQEHHELEPGRLGLLTGESDYVASHVLRVGDLIGRPAPYGAFVVVPNPHVVFVHVLGDDGTLDLLAKLPRLVAGSYGGMYPQLSPNLYWWADGVLERFAVTDGAGTTLTSTESARLAAAVDRFLVNVPQR